MPSSTSDPIVPLKNSDVLRRSISSRNSKLSTTDKRASTTGLMEALPKRLSDERSQKAYIVIHIDKHSVQIFALHRSSKCVGESA